MSCDLRRSMELEMDLLQMGIVHQSKDGSMLSRHAQRGASLLLVFFAATTFASLSGCSQQPLPVSHPEFAEQFGELPRLKKTSNLTLLRELRAVDEMGGTPNQLGSDSTPFHTWVDRAGRRETLPDDLNVATSLATAFTRGQIKTLGRNMEATFPKRFPPWPEELRKLASVRVQYEDARLAFREAISKPKCDFGLEFRRGLLADHSYVDYVRIGAELESYYAIESLQRGHDEEAMKAIEIVLLAARRLAALGHPSPRLASATLHQRAIWLMQAACDNKQRKPDTPETCLRLVQQELKSWPNERDVWIGDRADGLHAYEMIREGYLLALLSKKEMNRIEQEVGLAAFQNSLAANIDKDQKFYMQAMRRLIDACDSPYYQRVELFAELTQEMARLRETEEHPKVADRVLLSHVQIGQRLMAMDLSRFRGWSLALSELTGQKPSGESVNPLNGVAFRWGSDDSTVRLFGIGPKGADEPVVIRRSETRLGKRPADNRLE